MPASIKHLTDKKLNLTSLLAKWQDGLYYTAAIVKCDKINKRCFVCFEDGSEVWVKNRDLHLQLTLDQLNEDEDIVCCYCDDGTSQVPNEIILCDVCNQGYHQKCHNPPVDSSTIDDSDDTNDHKDWICSTCSYILNQSDQSSQQSGAQKRTQQGPPPVAPPPQKQPKLDATKHPDTQQQQQASQQQAPQQQASQQQASQQPKPKQQQPVQSPQAVPQKQPVKVKQTPTSQQPHSTKPSTGSPKPAATNIVQKQTPYYPLSSQVRAAVVPPLSPVGVVSVVATAPASSTIVVGNAVGRSKQDVVNQSNKSSQRQRQPTAEPQTSPNASQAKHAVRKSSVNFMPPVRQSALPVATRSPIPNLVPAAKSPQLSPASSTLVMVSAPTNINNVQSITKKSTNDVSTTSSTTNIVTLIPKEASPISSQFSEASSIRSGTDMNSNGSPVLQVLEPRAKSSITSTQISSLVARPATWTVESQLIPTNQKPASSSPSALPSKVSSVLDSVPASLATNNGNGGRSPATVVAVAVGPLPQPAPPAKVISSSASQAPTSSVATDASRSTSSQPTAVLNTNSNVTSKSS